MAGKENTYMNKHTQEKFPASFKSMAPRTASCDLAVYTELASQFHY